MAPGRGKAHPTPPDQPAVILRYRPAGEDRPPGWGKAYATHHLMAASHCYFSSPDYAVSPAGKDGRVSARAKPPTLPDGHAVILRYHPAGEDGSPGRGEAHPANCLTAANLSFPHPARL